MTMNGRARFVFAVFLIITVGGYFFYDYYSRHGESALLGRAQLYWNAIRINDLETAYGLEAEAAAGLLLPHEVERHHEWGRRLISFKLGAINYFQNHAEIEIIKEITRPDSTQIKTYPPKKDLWTFMNGQWFHGEPESGTSSMRKPPETPAPKIL